MTIDRIVIKGQGAISVEKWKTMPLPVRMGHVSRNEVQFFSGGQEVKAREAVAALR